MVLVQVRPVVVPAESRKSSLIPKIANALLPSALVPFAEANGMADPTGGFVSLKIGSA